MKVALLLSGYLRGYKEIISFIDKEILQKFSDTDIYLHITNDENGVDKYFNQIRESDIKAVISALNPICTIIEDNCHFSDDKRTNNTFNHWSKLFKLNQIKKLNETITSKKYDLVIKLRPDLNINSKNVFSRVWTNSIQIPKDSKIDKTKLINVSDNYICDAIAYGNSEQMDSYFDVFLSLRDLIIKHGPISETVLFEYLADNKITYDPIDIDFSFVLSKCNVFAICGDSGSGKSTLSDLLKSVYTDSFKLECDRYHKWERNDKNWDIYTHLNPNANFITKMNEDVFNLKIGNEVFQVDYDHNSGRFTEKQQLCSSNNLIVCGLHSLYDESLNENKIYDLKIYMDTDDKLKKKWKIRRDVTERGYSVSKVLENIQKRENDFIKYIEPQKKFADIIVRFFTTDNVNYNNIEEDNNVSLSLIFKSNFNLSKILKTLNTNNFKFDFNSTNKNFQVLTFDEYKDISFYNPQKWNKTYSFYDYILFCILNLEFN
jgi:uridine kinase